MIRLSRRYRFSSAHRLHAAALSDTENCATYGKCNNPFGHGHDYLLEVTVAGDVEPATGRVTDPGRLDSIVQQSIVVPFDGADLNRIEDFREAVPTTENLAIAIERRLVKAWPAGWPKLERIRIEETRRNKFELQR